MKSNRKRRYALAGLLAFVVATSSFAFAASNTVGDSNAGDGVGVVSGFNVTAVSWQINTNGNPADVDGVTFTIAPAAAGGVFARFRETASGTSTWSGWVTCTGTTSITCSGLSGISTLELDQLEVASAS